MTPANTPLVPICRCGRPNRHVFSCDEAHAHEYPRCGVDVCCGCSFNHEVCKCADVSELQDVIELLEKWANGPHSEICADLRSNNRTCRHTQARIALIQIKNAKDELAHRKEEKRS